VLSPLRKAAAAVIHPVTGFFSGLAHSGAIRDENARLRQENADLRTKNQQLSQAQAQVDDLEKLNKIDLPSDVQAVGARVFATGPSSFEWTVEIDVGSNRGVAVGNPVVSGDGLVGRVATVRSDSAVVQLVIDPNFAVGARLERSREIGVASGHGSGPMTLDSVDPEVPIGKGERVYTSGGPASGFPPTLLIGTVPAGAEPNPNLERTVVVTPAMRADRLEFVKVLLT
jgi:rod shape-determining protein MreC